MTSPLDKIVRFLSKSRDIDLCYPCEYNYDSTKSVYFIVDGQHIDTGLVLDDGFHYNTSCEAITKFMDNEFGHDTWIRIEHGKMTTTLWNYMVDQSLQMVLDHPDTTTPLTHGKKAKVCLLYYSSEFSTTPSIMTSDTLIHENAFRSVVKMMYQNYRDVLTQKVNLRRDHGIRILPEHHVHEYM